MATLPNSDRAVVERAKIDGYLLSLAHPTGRMKAAFFKRFGFRSDAPGALIHALLAHARDNSVSETEASAYGIKYRVDGPLQSPDGRNPAVSTVWIVIDGEVFPRFITAFPC
jgi:Domain of unknown function (DUF6883)